MWLCRGTTWTTCTAGFFEVVCEIQRHQIRRGFSQFGRSSTACIRPAKPDVIIWTRWSIWWRWFCQAFYLYFSFRAISVSVNAFDSFISVNSVNYVNSFNSILSILSILSMSLFTSASRTEFLCTTFPLAAHLYGDLFLKIVINLKSLSCYQ